MKSNLKSVWREKLQIPLNGKVTMFIVNEKKEHAHISKLISILFANGMGFQ